VGSAGGSEHQCLRAGIDGAVSVVQYQGAQFFPDGGASGLAGAQDRVAEGFKGVGKERSLRGLSGAISAFKSDE
jgi:hypothetical protein